MKTAQELADFVGGTLFGDQAVEIWSIGSLERAEHGALAYAEPKYLDRVDASLASCVLVPSGEFPGRTVIRVDNPRIAFARAAQWLIPRDRPFASVHETVIVAETAKLESDVAVGAWTVIEKGACIGPRTIVYPGCYIGENCRIGGDCVLFPNVVLYPGTQLGDRLTIHAGVVVGADGFGFVFDGTSHVKIPQVGHATIASDVEIGANSCVDRGALDETVVGKGTKIDNLCQVAHNVQIGMHAIVSSQTGIAGSSTIGNHATIGGQVGIGGYCRIDDHGIVGGQCGVPSRKRIPAGEVYWGTPAQPLKNIKVQQAHLNRLPKIAGEVKLLRAELDALKAKLAQDVP